MGEGLGGGTFYVIVSFLPNFVYIINRKSISLHRNKKQRNIYANEAIDKEYGLSALHIGGEGDS